jgi:acylphosphatase
VQDLLTLELVIDGSFCDDAMADWVVRRARLLNLSGWVRRLTQNRIQLQASGERVLVEALEVACSLGPIDAQVDTVSRREIATPDTFYRQPRQFVRYSVPPVKPIDHT